MFAHEWQYILLGFTAVLAFSLYFILARKEWKRLDQEEAELKKAKKT